jgi:hypothetical protein
MTGKNSIADGTGYRTETTLSNIPGIIDGSVTVHPEPSGCVSFRVIVGDRTISQHDVIELIVSAALIRNLGAALSHRTARMDDQLDSMLAFPCRIGICRNS